MCNNTPGRIKKEIKDMLNKVMSKSETGTYEGRKEILLSDDVYKSEVVVRYFKKLLMSVCTKDNVFVKDISKFEIKFELFHMTHDLFLEEDIMLGIDTISIIIDEYFFMRGDS